MSANDGECGGADSSAISRRKFCALAAGCVCGASSAPALGVRPVDIGTLGDFRKDEISEKFVHEDFFVIRHKGRLFTAIATCPHQGGVLLVDPRNPKRIICSNHNAVFDFEGVPSQGPVRAGLTRLGISVNPKGRVIVDPSSQFEQAQWNEKASFVAVK